MRATGIRGVMAVAVAAVLLTCAPPASAEFHLDVYSGAALTDNVELWISEMGLRGSTQGMKVDNSLVFGGRVGYWLGSLPWLGLAVDVFAFNPDLPQQTVQSSIAGFSAATGQALKLDLNVTAVSAELKARLRLLKDAAYPYGRLQPYLLVGPTLFISTMRDTNNFVLPRQSDTDTEAGIKAGAGVAFQILPGIAVFGEYRVTHFSPTWGFKDSSVSPSARFTLSTDVDTHQIVGGISFRF